jgi:VCBS repeat-containing protein
MAQHGATRFELWSRKWKHPLFDSLRTAWRRCWPPATPLPHDGSDLDCSLLESRVLYSVSPAGDEAHLVPVDRVDSGWDASHNDWLAPLDVVSSPWGSAAEAVPAEVWMRYAEVPTEGDAAAGENLAAEPSADDLGHQLSPGEEAADAADAANTNGGDLHDSATANADSEVVFFDSTLDNLADLLASLDRGDDRHLEIIALDERGIAGIGPTLASLGPVNAVHLVTHGDAGGLWIGPDRISSENLGAYQSQLLQWRDSLTDTADLLIYACDVAGSEAGRQLLAALAEVTQADVAASDDLTGCASRGGDWDLEWNWGTIETSLAFHESSAAEWKGILATVAVTTTADVVDAPGLSSIGQLLADPGNDGAISLREAIIAANNSNGDDIVVLPAGLYQFDVANQGSDDVARRGDLDIVANLELRGADAATTIIDALGLDRVFQIHGGTSTFRNLTITGGDTNSKGGGILVEDGASLVLNQVIVSNNSAGNDGGGIFSAGDLELTDVMLVNNSAAGHKGGGLFAKGDVTNLDRVTIANNAAIEGGGAFFEGGGTLLNNVTISGNVASDKGGGFSAASHVQLNQSTVAFNIADRDGGGITAEGGGGSVTMKNTILALNSTNSGNDLNGKGNIDSQGFNIVFDGVTTAAGRGDLIGIDPLLGPLQYNGGFVQTHALGGASVAVNGGGNIAGLNQGANGILFDSIPDIGAYQALNPLEDAIYWLDAAERAISRIKADGSGRQTILDNLTAPFGFDIDAAAGKIYWSDTNDRAIRSANLDGSGVTVVANPSDGISYPTGLDIVDNRVYFLDSYAVGFNYGYHLTSVNTDGTALTILADMPFQRNPIDITVDAVGQMVYWTRDWLGFDEIYRTRLDGNGPVEVVFQGPDVVNPRGITIDANGDYLYWAEGTEINRVPLANLTNAAIESLATGLSYPVGIALDSLGQNFYWTDINSDEIRTAASDGSGATQVVSGLTAPVAVAVLSFQINHQNAAPIAVPGSYLAVEGGSITLDGGGSYDPDGAILSYEWDLNYDGITFDSDASGQTTSFSTLGLDGPTTRDIALRVVDDEGASHVSATTITILNAPPQAGDDQGALWTVSEDGLLAFSSADLLANDVDPYPSDTLTVIALDSPTGGVLTSLGGNAFQFDPAGQFESLAAGQSADVTFSYTIIDDDGAQDSGAVTISVRGVNDGPIAQDDTVVAVWQQATHWNLLTNDSDRDDGIDLTSLVIQTPPLHGTLTVNADGSVDYLHDGSTATSDTFTYLISDASGAVSAPATVNVTIIGINVPPTAVGDSYNLAEDTTLLTVAGVNGVRDNDSDPDGDALVVDSTPVTGPTHGTLVLHSDGSFSYTPDGNFAGTDSFTYQVQDGRGGSGTGTVMLSITSVNDAPVATGDSYSVGEDQILNVPVASGVLSNDVDVDGDPLTARLVTGPDHGAVTLALDGSFSYRADADYFGPDEFTYQADDGQGGTCLETVTVVVTAVNDVPLGTSDFYVVAEDTVLSVSVAAGVLANDVDPEGDPLTAQLIAGPVHGTLLLRSDGSLEYQPLANYFGTDQFTYRAVDGQDASTDIQVNLTVTASPDLPPTPHPDSYLMTALTQLVVEPQGVLENDSNPDQLSVTAVLVDAPQHGTLVWDGNGGFSYTPEETFAGIEQFSYVLQHEGQQSAPAEVVIQIVAAPSTTSLGDASQPVVVRTSSDSEPDSNSDDDAPLRITSSDMALLRDESSRTNDRGSHFREQTPSSSVETAMLTPSGTGGSDQAGGFGGDWTSFVLRGSTGDEDADDESGSSWSGVISANYDFTREFWNDLERMRQALTDASDSAYSIANVSLSVASLVGVGTVVWTVRSGVMLTSLVAAQMPAWRNMDPLPIVDFVAKKVANEQCRLGASDETLETIIAAAHAEMFGDL